MLENLLKVHAESPPFRDRLKVTWDLESFYKSIWLTGYILVTWAYQDDWRLFKKSFGVSIYPSGAYGGNNTTLSLREILACLIILVLLIDSITRRIK